MNFLAHALIASRQRGATARQVLGAVLPDLAGMATLSLDRALLPDDVADGVRSHYAADQAFHADRSFLRGSGALRRAALETGLPAGASRAIGHVGWELLLDGRLPGHTEAVQRFGEALDQAPAASVAFCSGDRARWNGLARDLAARRWWLRYDDPTFVAERLFGMLSRRPRLAFPEPGIDRVVAVLESAQPAIATDAGPLLQRVLHATNERA